MLQNTIKELKGFLGALFVALLIRTFIIQPFVIPSGSMYPTLEIGDFILVPKFSFGFSNYSLPFSPHVIEGRIAEMAKPERGQVIVFRNPIGETTSLFKKLTFKDDSLDYIKRLVGLPGDRIQVKEGILNINSEPVKLEKVDDYSYHDPRADYATQAEAYKYKSIHVMPQYIETLPNGVSYRILKEAPFGKGDLDNTPEYIVPEAHYFFMGDNRDNSGDSRVQSSVGFIPEDHIIGPAKVIFFSTEAKWYDVLHWITGVRPSRIFNIIR